VPSGHCADLAQHLHLVESRVVLNDAPVHDLEVIDEAQIQIVARCWDRAVRPDEVAGIRGGSDPSERARRIVGENSPIPRRREGSSKVDDQQKRDQIVRIFDILNRRELDELDAIFDASYVDHSPMGELCGVEPFKQMLGSWLAAFPDSRFEVSNIVVDGDLAAWQARFTGTNSGSLAGMPATGKAVDVLAVHMGRINEEGRPIEHWTGNDMLAMLQQLGLAPSLAPAPTG
jgi:predicted ester cyclase